MALKNVKANSSGSAHKARYNTREEAKAASKKIRREESKKAVREVY
jgi:hypothetical protein